MNMLGINEITDSLNKETEGKSQVEILKLKNTVTEIKGSMDGPNSRMTGTVQRMSELEDKTEVSHQTAEKTGETNSLRDLCDCNKELASVSSESWQERRRAGRRKLEERMTENFPNSSRMETCRFKKMSELQGINLKKPTPRYIRIKFLKIKDKGRNLEGSQRKTTAYRQEKTQTEQPDLTVQARRKQHNTFRC